MPGKEIAQNYPSCNRAFALRMMNPTSYAEERVSVFDKEIQPVIKKSIAKNVSDLPGGSFHRQLSADTISLDSRSTSSTDTSFSEMDLYDIDEIENEAHNDDFGMIRQHSSLDTYTRVKKVQQQQSEIPNGNNHMYRSHSSADGFDGHFSRGSPSRASMPVRLHSGSVLPRDSARLDGTSTSQGDRKVYRNEAVAYLQGKGRKKVSPKQGSSLTRSHSLKGLKGERIPVGIPADNLNSTGHRSTPDKGKSSTKVRVAATKSSQLRAKLHDSNQSPAPRNAPSLRATASKYGKHRHHGSFEDYSESDSGSTVFSETDIFNPRASSRGSNRHSQDGTRISRLSSNRRRLTSDQRSTSPTSLTTTKTTTKKQQLHQSDSNNKSASHLINQLPKHDTFSSKLSQLCTLISERHPGDFQILETLVEMQTAYEDRNVIVKNTISGLRQHIHTLEYKLANSPNIPGLVIPLMRATNAFQNQLQSIMDSHGVVSHDASIQFPECNSGCEITMDEISEEANSVAKQIEKVGLNSTSHNEIEVHRKNMNGHAELNEQISNRLAEPKSHLSNESYSNLPNGHAENEMKYSEKCEPAKNKQQENNYHNSYYHDSHRVTTEAAAVAAM